MKISVVIPREHYDALLRMCDDSQPEYELLVNGAISNNERGDIAEVMCEVEQAEKLLDLARRLNPEAAPIIAESIQRGKEILA